MNQLKIGEKILSMDANGNTIFSEVLLFLDRNESQTREFVKIETDGGAAMTVTPAHLVLVWKSEKQQTKFTFAERVEEGDYVLVNINNNLEPRKVISIKSELHKGVFAPLTTEGTIIVDSITASCYALVDTHSLAHWGFMPIRVLNTIRHWFGDPQPTESRQIGVYWYAKVLTTIKRYLLPSDWLYQT